MPINGLPDAYGALNSEGELITLKFKRLDDHNGQLTWTLPPKINHYNGILITGAIKSINPSNYPTNGVKYRGSTDFDEPADKINNAQVVVALYNDETTTSVALTNLDPEQVYFFSAHLINNVRMYYPLGVRSYAEETINPGYARDVPVLSGPPSNPVVGQAYYDDEQKLLFSWDGRTWQTAKEQTTLTGSIDPDPFQPYPFSNGTRAPQLGDFFYNTTTNRLKSFNGSEWILADTVEGGPMTAKYDVGTNLNNSARLNMVAALKKMLGWPTICVELTDEQFDVSIDNSIQELRHRTDVVYNKQYFFLQSLKNQQTYYLNDPATGTNRIVDVLKVHRLNLLGLVNFAPDNIYAQQFLNQFYAPGVQYDLVSIHLVHAMSETYSQLFAGDIGFNWREASRELQLYRVIVNNEKILIETTCEKTEQEILNSRWTQQWIQQWAKAELYQILGNIRGKFATLPGPGGGLQLNADTLIQQAQTMQEDCLRQIRDLEIGQNGPDTFFSPIVIG